ncbi:GNAT family N-acetyltransferase [Streptomyces sp. NPDC006355]|uniref:GNAT family N-acetyltransferase n=1 Tax=Streptomyces sp. NPDC006355 TaxID=3156758 RepID=UPI0033B6688B
METEEEPVIPPVPEYLSPLRWRWILFTTRRHEVRFLYWPPQHPAGHRCLRMFDRDGYDIGRLVWVVCDTCRVGSINKISIDPGHQRQGFGRRLIRRALADGTDYAWQTTHQSPEAKQFFPALEVNRERPWGKRPGPPEHRPHWLRPRAQAQGLPESKGIAEQSPAH